MKTAIILLLSFMFVNSQNSCPSREDIKPCGCTVDNDDKLWIICEGIQSSDELIKAVKGMEGISVSTFNLENSNVGILPSNAFTGIDIQVLNIVYTNLTQLSENRNTPPFLGLESSLEYLAVRESFVNISSPLSFLSLSHLKKLDLLHLEGNIMPTIGNNWFESGPYNLKEIHFYDSSTAVVGSNAFHALLNLRSFSLSGGSITEFTRDMLPQPAKFLEIIDLSKNKIRSLPENMFTKMPSLEEVYLERNEISTIDEVVWAPVWSQLNTAFLVSNPIRCDKDIKWIYKYRFPETLRGNCAVPEKLFNKELQKLNITDFE